MKIPKIFNQSEIASKMFPNNKDAASHLSRKVNGKNGQSFNQKDVFKLIEIVKSETDKFISELLQKNK